MSTRNRINTALNPYQNYKDYKRILCVCSAGLLRSPTIASFIIKHFDNVNVRAAGLVTEFALIPVDEVLSTWADIIIFAEQEHQDLFNIKFDHLEYTTDQQLVLNIPDEYNFNSDKLIEEIKITLLPQLKYEHTTFELF